MLGTQPRFGAGQSWFQSWIERDPVFTNAEIQVNLIFSMQTVQRQSFFFTYRYWYPVAALAACAHLRL
jgi:hypothetical protein